MKQIKDFAVSSQEAGFDKFLKVYNEYFKFDFFGNAKFYGAKNGENYQTGQAWITPITPSQAIALLTNQTTDKMNTLENSCFQFKENDEASKECIRIINDRYKAIFEGKENFIYWVAGGIADTFYKEESGYTKISPSDYLALLTGKQLTEGESINTNYKLIPMSKITNEAREIAVRWGDNMKDDFISQKHKLASDIMNYSTQQTAHLQQQLNTLTSEIKRLQEKYDENGYDCSNEIKLLRIENHIDFTLSFYHKEVTDLQQQLKEAKELLTLFADAKGVYQDNINKANQFLTRNK